MKWPAVVARVLVGIIIFVGTTYVVLGGWLPGSSSGTIHVLQSKFLHRAGRPKNDGTQNKTACRPRVRQAWKHIWKPDERIKVLPVDIMSRVMYQTPEPMPVLRVFNGFCCLGYPLDFSAKRCGTARRCRSVSDRAEADITLESDMMHVTSTRAVIFGSMEYHNDTQLATEYCDIYSMTYTHRWYCGVARGCNRQRVV